MTSPRFKARVIKGSGGGRRMIEVPKIQYDDFNFEDKVEVKKTDEKKKVQHNDY